MPEAYPHSVIHTDIYYVNVTNLLLNQVRVNETTKDDIIDVLQEIAHDLKKGRFPIRHDVRPLKR